ncbi:type II secretion system protein N [Novosphingopyxis sp.]|uniref:type II secretion system protein N n=1 Tax=Novosphingopyxis sp. TaxID=2709690 RepID=UPI003B5A0779
MIRPLQRLRAPKRPRLVLAALILFLLLLLIFLPLRAALGWANLGARGIGAREAGGLVWSGYINDLTVGETSLGSVGAGLRPLPLFIGQLRFHLDRDASIGRPAVDAELFSGLGRFGVSDANLTVPASSLFGSLPLGEFTLQNVAISFVGNRCIHAEGTVRATVNSVLPGLELPGGMVGTLRCESAALLVPLASQTGLETLDIRIAGDGSYTTRLKLAGDRSSVAGALAAAGLTQTGDGFVLEGENRF